MPKHAPFTAEDAANGTEARRISALKKRAQHTQTLDEASALDPTPFTSCQFVAYVNGRDITFDNKGNMGIKLTVPPEFMEYALPIRRAFQSGVPLSVDIQVWEPYLDYDTSGEGEDE